ncbi:MAG TPA: hypothetical protein VF064_06395 [Pyrinomonadaceae bacterium]
MLESLRSRRRPASARRQLLSVIIAAFIILQPVLLAAAQRKGVAAKLRNDTGGLNISVTTLGTPITQNFDTLATSGTTNAWADNSTIAGWYAQFAATTNPTTYRADAGGSNTGAIYSWGTGTATERAFGSIGSGTTTDVYWAVQLTNNTGSTITSLDVSYIGEQWRAGGCQPTPCTPAAQTAEFQYQVANAGTITDANAPTTGWLDHNPLDFTSPVPGTSTATALDGNAAANRTALSSTITVSVAPGQDFWLRWVDINHANNDHGLSIDDFSVTPNGAAPTPTPTPTPGLTLSINDVSQNEGNSGTTAFNFTVSLSSSTHGGVTYDICSDDGTAQDGSNPGEDTDYSPICFANQSIPNGSDTAQHTVNVNGDTNGEANETFFVNVTNVTGATIADGQGLGTILNDDLTPIHDIQGNGASSPLAGQSVTTTGIVTLLRTGSNAGGGAASGFFLQSPDAAVDADPNTSQGIFVFTSSVPTYTSPATPVAVGDELTVTGTVVEFNGLTEIGSVTNITAIDTGNTLPTAVTLDSTILDPTAPSTQSQLEKFESMRLSAAALLGTVPNDNFFDVETVLASVPRRQVFREPGIPASDPVPPDPTSGMVDPNIPIWDENPERLKLDTNGRAGSPNNAYTSNVTFSNVSGPLDFAFGEYRLVADAGFTASPNMSAVPVPTPEADEFTVAGYNIENFNNNATQRQKAALTIRNVLHYPDIIGAVEIFDLADLQALRDQVNNDAVAAGDPNPQYEAYLVEQDGTSEDNDQDVGYLVKTARVAVTSVTQEREEETFEEPGGGTAILHDRPPLVLDATVAPSGANPQRVLVVVNHLRSFIDIELVAGDGPRVREKRKKQAESIAGLLQELQTNNPGVPVISVGDYNAFQFNSGYDDLVSVLKGNPTPDDRIVVDQSPDLVNPDLFNLIDELPAAERYSFNFEGTMQTLDHVLVNTAARARNTRIAIARVNADFPEAPAAVFASNASIPERNSDHDPVVSYFALGQPQPTGSVIISEFRFRGPSPSATPSLAPDNEFVEVYNNTDSDITVSTLDGSAGWAIVASDGTTLLVIPNGTVIPARGHWLGVNANGYSLSDYGGTGAAEGDDGWIGSAIPDDGGVALFRTANPAFFTEAERLDAAGYTTAPALYREGAGLPTGGPEFDEDVAEWSFYRDFKAPGGRPRDTGDNAADFLGVSTDGAGTGLGQRLGAPGPENLSSPVARNAQFPLLLLDATQPAAAPPNRVRDFTMDPMNNSPHGTLTIRRRVVNNTGQDVSRLRVRIINITTFPAPAGTADLRARTSPDVMISNIMDAATCAAEEAGPPPCTVNVVGTILEEPPAQSGGGGWNSTLSIPVSLADGDSVNVQFLLGIQQTGAFRFYINIEALTGSIQNAPRRLPLSPSPRKKAATR